MLRNAQLLKAVKAAGVQKRAIKVSLDKFKKATLYTVQRMMRSAGVRIGVRFQGRTGYLWNMSDDEIKRAEQKAERLATIRSRKGKAKQKGAA